MTRSWELENEPRRSTKHARQTGEEECGSATEEPVAIVKPRDNQCPDERVTGIHGEGAPNRSKLPDVVVGTDDQAVMFFSKIIHKTICEY